ncbi:MAG: MBL fold metallo-hydrolase [Candidatus Thorarchaeota archaeon]
MKIGDIIITPIGAESMGVRSLCVRLSTPDVRILFDPSAALARRYRLEPHPLEYRRLHAILDRIHIEAKAADVLSISHYHYDHVRPGFTDFRYTFGSLEDLREMFADKQILAKDYRDYINASQRRRGYYFEKDLRGIAKEIIYADGQSFDFDDTHVVYSSPVPHGPEGTRLGFVLITTVTYQGSRFVFAPDVQGPISTSTTDYILSLKPDLAIVGGPPTYLDRLREYMGSAAHNLQRLVLSVPIVVVDHHLLRSPSWHKWLSPIEHVASDVDHRLLTMATLGGTDPTCLEAERKSLYREMPPSTEFIDWTNATDTYKTKNPPPL